MPLDELNVDWSQSEEEILNKKRHKTDDYDSDDNDEQPLMRRRSGSADTKKRLAILDEDDDDDDEDDSETRYNFELPPCDDSSSEEEDEVEKNDDNDDAPWSAEWGVGKKASAERDEQEDGPYSQSDDEVEEQIIPDNPVCNEYHAPEPRNEEELLEAAFFAPPAPRRLLDNDEADDGNQYVESAYALQRNTATDEEVVDLCSDDDEGENKLPARSSVYPFFAPRRTRATQQEGLRLNQSKSPRFNADSRAACLLARPSSTTWDGVAASHPRSPARTSAVAYHPAVQPTNDDDIEDFWSSEDERRTTNPRLVTVANNEHPPVASSFRPSFASTAPQEAFVQAPLPSTSRRQSFTAQQRPDPQQQRPRRIRDAAASNAALAGSLVGRRKSLSAAVSSTQTPFVQSDQNLWYRTHASQPSVRPAGAFAQQPPRNDLMGGSGVGAGNCSLYSRRGDDDDDDEPPPARRPPSSRGRGGGGSKKRGGGGTKRKATGGAKKKSWGGGRKNFYRGKGRGRGGGRKQGGGRGRGRSQMSSNPDYSRADNDLGHVGGANIIF